MSASKGHDFAMKHKFHDVKGTCRLSMQAQSLTVHVLLWVEGAIFWKLIAVPICIGLNILQRTKLQLIIQADYFPPVSSCRLERFRATALMKDESSH